MVIIWLSGTPPRTARISELKSSLGTTIFGLKSGPEFFYFEVERAPSELLLASAKKSAQKG